MLQKGRAEPFYSLNRGRKKDVRRWEHRGLLGGGEGAKNRFSRFLVKKKPPVSCKGGRRRTSALRHLLAEKKGEKGVGSAISEREGVDSHWREKKKKGGKLWQQQPQI